MPDSTGQLVQPSVDQPYYREETVRIGRPIHVYSPIAGTCFMAFIDQHPTPDGQPHPDDWVKVHVPGKFPATKMLDQKLFPRFIQERPDEKPRVASWHWIRACPWMR